MRMRERYVSEQEILEIISMPTSLYRPRVRDRIEHFGAARDGRRVYVVTNRARTVVISVVVE
jgi:hypothetical protein